MIKKRVIILALGASLAGIIAGWYLGGNVLPLLAALNSERTNTVKTVNTVAKDNKQNRITKTVETVVHSHDGLPVHKHVVTVELAVIENTPHGTYHNFPASQTTTPNTTAGGAGNAASDHAAHPEQGGATPAQNESLDQQVIIVGREFIPASLTVPVGAKVTWSSKESESHTVTSDTGLFNGPVNTNGSFSFTFTEAGVFNYHCDNRPEMMGTITVK